MNVTFETLHWGEEEEEGFESLTFLPPPLDDIEEEEEDDEEEYDEDDDEEVALCLPGAPIDAKHSASFNRSNHSEPGTDPEWLDDEEEEEVDVVDECGMWLYWEDGCGLVCEDEDDAAVCLPREPIKIEISISLPGR